MAEKFKPTPLRDLKGEQKELVQETIEEWQDGDIVKDWFGIWKEYIAWFWGYQYLFYNRYSGALEDITPLVEREVKNVYNRIYPMIRQMWGELSFPRKYYVEPNTQESEDIKAGKLGSQVIEHTNFNGKFQLKTNRANFWALLTGNIYWKEWWNRNLYGFIKDPSGKGVVREPGEVDFNYVIPFNVRPDSLAKGREGWRWLIEGKKTSKLAIEQEFKLDPGTLPPDSLKAEDDDIFGVYGATWREKQKPKEETGVRIERWFRPYSGWENGRFMVIACDWLLYDGVNPSPDYQIPYFQPPGIVPIPNDQFYDSAVRVIQEIQRNFNRYGSMVDEMIQNYRAKNMVPRGSLSTSEFKIYTRNGVDYVLYDPVGAGTPHWQNPPPIPPEIINWLKFLENEIETESSVRKVSYGQLPKYAQRASGVLFQGMKEQDVVPLNPMVEEQNDVHIDMLKFRLQLVQKHYSVPRLVKSTGRSEEQSVNFLEGVELRNNDDVRVKGGVELFSQKAAKREVVGMLIEKDMIKEPRQALELLDYKGMEEFMEEEFIDERHAYRENEQFKQGLKPEVDEDDNHEVHFRIHNNERKKEEFKTWPKKRQQNLINHYLKHKEYMQPPAEEAETAPPEGEVTPPAPEEAPTPEELLATMALGGGY